jgi:hypothetical protein
MKHFLLLLIAALSMSLTAQTEQSVSLNLEGQLAASTDGKGLFINAGGPALKFSFPRFAFSVNMMPSLRFQNEAHKPLVTPILGCGPQFYFLKERRFIVSFPCYYYSSSQVWTFTAGIGYVLTKKYTKQKNPVAG